MQRARLRRVDLFEELGVERCEEPTSFAAVALASPQIAVGYYSVKSLRGTNGGPAGLLILDAWPSPRPAPLPRDDAIRHHARYLRAKGEIRRGGFRYSGGWIELLDLLHGCPNPLGWVLGERVTTDSGNPARPLLAYHGDFFVGAIAPLVGGTTRAGHRRRPETREK